MADVGKIRITMAPDVQRAFDETKELVDQAANDLRDAMICWDRAVGFRDYYDDGSDIDCDAVHQRIKARYPLGTPYPEPRERPQAIVSDVSPVMKIALDIADAQNRSILDVLDVLDQFCVLDENGIKQLRPGITNDEWAAAGLMITPKDEQP